MKRLRSLVLSSISLLACALAPQLGAQEKPIIENLNPDTEVEYDSAAGMVRARNGVMIRYADTTLTATEVDFDQNTAIAHARGAVRLQRKGHLFIGQKVEYNFNTGQMNAGEFRMGHPPFFVGATALNADTTNDVFAATDGMVTTDDVQNPIYRIQAKELKITMGESIEAKHATIRLGNVPVMYFPYYNRSLKRHPNNWVLTPGYRSRYGAFLLTTYNYQITTNFTGALHLDYRTRRGAALGPEFRWDLGRWGTGSTMYYYAKDEDPMIDPSPIRIPDDRQHVRFSHKATLRTNFTAKINVDAQSDPRVRRDFFEYPYRKDPQPKTFLELDHVWPNYELNLLAQPQVNDFFSTVERLPDLKLSAFRQRIGDSPLFYEGENSAAYLRMQSAANPDTNYSAGRFDSFHQVVYPLTFFEWLNFEPRVGGRYTHYTEQEGFGSVLTEEDRFVFNTGAETSFKASRVWGGARNKTFDIDGLRHIIQPSLNYVYVPNPSAHISEIPQFDTEYPSLRLLPIDYPDYNAIDSIDSQNVLRMGLRNKVQTKRKGEIQNVINSAIYTDWRLDPRPGQGTFADLYSDLDLRPWHWLTLSSEIRYDIDDARLRMANHSAILIPNDIWSVRLGHFYFEDDPRFRFGPFNTTAANNTFYTRAYYRFNQNWGFRMSHHFEARDGTLEEQYYTVYRDLRAWTGALTFRQRDHRGIGPDDFAVAFTFSLKAFPRYKLGEDAEEPSFLFGS
ncbi:MAG TPA: LPS assembly protein LptD [Methylomirabilota bacterium]|nr:LPS assembly protein LptD [Methylomirabilota bacterium]